MIYTKFMKNTRNSNNNRAASPEIFTTWSNDVATGKRLDAKYWLPAIRELQISIQNGKYKSRKLGDFITDIRYGLSTTNNYADTGIPFLRILNLKNDGLDLKNIVYLSDEQKNEIGKAIVHEGDLLISRSGSVGIVVVVPKSADGFSFGSFMIKFCLNDKINKQYIATWLNCEASRKLIEREKIGAIQGNITIETIKNFDIPVPPISVQNEVVRKNQEAYEEKQRKEEEIKGLLASIDGYVLGKLGIEMPEGEASNVFEVWSDTISKRLDPMYFHPIRIKAVAETNKSHFPVDQLSKVAQFRRNLVTQIPANMPYVGLENIVSNSGEYVEGITKETISSAFLFKKGDVLFPKLRPYLNKVFYADFDGICSTEFHVLEAQNCEPYYLFSFLSRKIVVEQTSRLMTGNTLPRLQTEDIENLLVPVPDKKTQDKVIEGVQERYQKMKTIRAEVVVILENAGKQVEQMILANI